MMDRPFSFSWKNLTLWVNDRNTNFWSTKTTKKILLENESGRFHSGSLIAITGPSGVGKTTFLATLAGKNLAMTGFLGINDKMVSAEYIRNISGYLYQDDIYVESLTILECYKFMNALKLNKPQEIVNRIIVDLNLDKSKNTEIKNLSSGEKKRLSLGIELLNNPEILFCDEPTTGLDSHSAIKIIEKLELNSRRGKLIFVTIHQPSSQIFNYFTHIILISPNKIFYQGERSGIKQYFDNLNLICPINYNPADFYLKCVSNRQNTVRYNNDLFQNVSILENSDLRHFKVSSRSNILKEVYWLLWRYTIDAKRNLSFHAFQFLLLMITATILAIVYSFVTFNDKNFVQNVRGIIFFFTSELIFTHTYSVINTFPNEYHIILREKEVYSSSAYFLSKILATIPRNIIQPLMFLAINFMLIEFFANIWVFIEMFGVLFCACISATIFGFCISAIFTSIEYMELFIAPFELLTMLAAGILIKLPSLKYFSFVKYLSPFYYAYESLSIIYWLHIDAIGCENSSLTCYETGKEVLEEFGFFTETISVFRNLFYMGLLSLIIALVGYFTLRYKTNNCVVF